MLEIEIPGFGFLRLENLVMDYNGTLAIDGRPVQGLKDKLWDLSQDFKLHVITADTFGRVSSFFSGLPAEIHILSSQDQAKEKLHFVKNLGAKRCVCLGNGRNDCMMLREAALGIGVLLQEGMAREVLLSCDLITHGVISALELLQNPLRLKASLRS